MVRREENVVRENKAISFIINVNSWAGRRQMAKTVSGNFFLLSSIIPFFSACHSFRVKDKTGHIELME